MIINIRGTLEAETRRLKRNGRRQIAICFLCVFMALAAGVVTDWQFTSTSSHTSSVMQLIFDIALSGIGPIIFAYFMFTSGLDSLRKARAQEEKLKQ